MNTFRVYVEHTVSNLTKIHRVDTANHDLTFFLLSRADLNPSTWELPDVLACGT